MYGKRKNIFRSNDKRTLEILFTCALVFCVLSISFITCFYNTTQKITYADYETDILNNATAVVNFNQLCKFNNYNVTYAGITLNVTEYEYKFSGTASATDYLWSTIPNLTKDHTFYIKTPNSESFTKRYNYGETYSTTDEDLIFTLTQSNLQYSIYFVNGNTYDKSFKPYLIDLTLMFGENLPNIAQCRELFKSDYYNYTTGQAVSISGLNSFAEGVNYAYEQLNFDVVNSSAYTTAYIDPTINNSNAFVERYVDMATNGQYLYLKARGYLSIPLSQTLQQGSILNFGYTDPGQGGSGNYLYVGILYNNNFIPVMNISTHLTDDTTTNLTMTLPYSTNTIVFVESSTEDYFTFVDSAYWLGDLQVNYAQFDVQVLINSIVNDELRKQKEFYEGYYSYGEGYTKIFNEGLQQGSATGQAFTDSMSFTGSVFHAIGEILSMQVIPNIPLGLFVALPLLVGLLFFIVKIAKGSGG